MNDQTGTNGHKALRMTIESGFDSDPLRKPSYHVAVEMPDGSFQNISKIPVQEPIEMLRLDVEKNQLVGFKDRDTIILDAHTGEIVERFNSYRPEPQSPNEPITPHNEAIRDRWIGRMFAWLLPKELLEAEDNPENQAKIKACLDEQGISMSVSPGGTQVIFFRKDPGTQMDGVLTAWQAFT